MLQSSFIFSMTDNSKKSITYSFRTNVKIGFFENDMKKIHELVNEKMVDLAGRFIFNSQGQEIFNFGKHKGKTIEQALKEEPGYYEWMMKGDFPLDTKRKLTQVKLRALTNR